MNPKAPLLNSMRYHSGEWEAYRSGVIVEMPVTLTVNGHAWLTFMCTPTELDALAVGFLYNEGVIKTSEDIELVDVCPTGENIDVWLKKSVDRPQEWRRTSGCTGGVTGVRPELLHPELKNGILLTPAQVDKLLKDLNQAQELYLEVGGVHTSILSDGKRTVISAEDIGRHNSLDKIAGRCLLDNIKVERRILVTTGRISSDMIQKAARIGASVVISRTSASSLSVKLADQWGITLIGYARRDQFTIYTHPERVEEINMAVTISSEEE